MMTTVVNKKTLEQYRQIFGTEKMKNLWNEFQKKFKSHFKCFTPYGFKISSSTRIGKYN